MSKTIYWFDTPEEHNYPAAEEFMTLYFTRETAHGLSDKMRRMKTEYFKAKDILRAAQLPLLDEDHPQVKKTLEKIEDEKKLSPLLLLRSSVALVVADGYHRLCAVYHHDHDVKIPCKIV